MMILPYDRARRVAKLDAREEALRRLRRFVDGSERELALFLVRNINGLSQAITYHELIEWVLTGAVTEEFLAEWRRQYAVTLSQVLLPTWERAAQTAGAQVMSLRPGFSYDPWSRGLARWGERRAAELLTNSTAEMREGVRAALKRGAWGESLGVDELARVIRPVVGLNTPQVRANQNYYRSLTEGGLSPAKAREKAVKYAARQHRYRAHMIARTELAFAYASAGDQAVHQAQELGYMGKTVKEWCTAETERTCPFCAALDGVRAGMDQVFPYGGRRGRAGPLYLPPAHPHCMCAVLYVEITQPERTGE